MAHVRCPSRRAFQPEGEAVPIIQPAAAPIAAHLPAHQRSLAIALPGAPQPRRRRLARPFIPVQSAGPYRLPRDAAAWLSEALAPYRNREAAFLLAVFLARYWSTPGRLAGAFPIDRRALTAHAQLGLTEAQVRGALRVLEAVGFLARAIPPRGNGYQRTGSGELHRRPVLFAFGAEYAQAFAAANRRAQASRQRREGERRAVAPSPAPWPSQASPTPQQPNSPRVKSVAEPKVLMGEIGKQPPTPEPESALESALDRLLQGIRQSRGA